MCTVSFIPLPDERFLFTSNRDENPKRAAAALHELEVEGKTLFFPQDAQAKGSWFVFSNTNQFVCVLNGAFEPHLSEGSYRLSRGKWHFSFLNTQIIMTSSRRSSLKAWNLLLLSFTTKEH